MNKIHLNENHEKLCLNLPFVYHFNSFNCCFASLVASFKTIFTAPCSDFIFRRGSFRQNLIGWKSEKADSAKRTRQKIERSGFALRTTVRKSDRVILLQNSFSENLTDWLCSKRTYITWRIVYFPRKNLRTHVKIRFLLFFGWFHMWIKHFELWGAHF